MSAYTYICVNTVDRYPELISNSAHLIFITNRNKQSMIPGSESRILDLEKLLLLQSEHVHKNIGSRT